MSSQPVIVVIGSLNVDYVSYTARIPSAGETLTSTGFEVGCGGKGANQAVACAKLSRKKSDLEHGAVTVKMLGAVGSDEMGTMMKRSLADSGIDTSAISVSNTAKTGVAIIIVEEATGENRILLSPNANFTLTPEMFREPLSPKPSLLVMQLEIPLATVLQILKVAQAENVPVLLNPAPAVRLPEEAYKSITHLIVNETEAAILSSISESEVIEPNLPKIAQRFLDLGTQNVLITLGAKGVYYANSKGSNGLVPARKVKVVDTTAAGDTFIGAYAVAILTGQDLASAVTRANKAAAITVERKGAQVSIPWQDEVVYTN